MSEIAILRQLRTSPTPNRSLRLWFAGRNPPDRNFAGRVGAAAMKRGLLIYPMQGSVDGISGDHLLLAPPAIITAGQITWAVE